MMDNIVSFTTAHALPATASFIVSFFGAWLAARFALYRFYREKVWERKIAAYTANLKLFMIWADGTKLISRRP
jgi:hypothetical protein